MGDEVEVARKITTLAWANGFNPNHPDQTRRDSLPHAAGIWVILQIFQARDSAGDPNYEQHAFAAMLLRVLVRVRWCAR